MTALRIVFFGTAEIAVPSLEALNREPGISVVAVVTQPDREKGRDLKLLPSAVKEAAIRLGLLVLQPERCRSESVLQALSELCPDLGVVAAYGQILPQALLDLPRHGCLNVHASILPRHRGAAPIQWAILEGDQETGITLMKMDAGLDTGPVLVTERTPIGSDDTAQTVHDRLGRIGAGLLVRTLPDYVAGRIVAQAQPAEGVTYARKIVKEDGRLDWRQDAAGLERRVRALTPWPGAFTLLPGEGRPMLLKLFSASVEPERTGEPGTVLEAGRAGLLVGCGGGSLRFQEVQREGGRRLAVREFIAGHALPVGMRLGGMPLLTNGAMRASAGEAGYP